MNTFTDKQMDIINSAIELIAEKGIQKLTIKNLSQKVDRTEGALYRHFHSKIDIISGILQLFRQNKGDALQKLKELNITAPEKLDKLLSERFRDFTANPAIAAVIFSEEIFQNEKSLSSQVFKIMQDSQSIIEAIIAEGQSDNQIRDDIPAQQLALLITGSLRLLVKKWRLAEFSFDLQIEGQKLCKSINMIMKK